MKTKNNRLCFSRKTGATGTGWQAIILALVLLTSLIPTAALGDVLDTADDQQIESYLLATCDAIASQDAADSESTPDIPDASSENPADSAIGTDADDSDLAGDIDDNLTSAVENDEDKDESSEPADDPGALEPETDAVDLSLPEFDGYCNPFFVIPPVIENSQLPRGRAYTGTTPPAIEAEVTLYPPPYAPSQIDSSFGFKGAEWYYISQNGFTANYNRVRIVSGYYDDDWLYGVEGDSEHNAIFSANSTIHCMDAGMTPPCPGGNNTRRVNMVYSHKSFFNNHEYYVYWSAETYHYDADSPYVFGGGPQRMGFFLAIPLAYPPQIEKHDVLTKAPVDDTEFTLYSYPVDVVDGYITTDVSLITAKDSAWREVDRQVTDQTGRINFKSQPFGYYMIDETRPNPRYKSLEESGFKPRFIAIERGYQPVIQVFEDEPIHIGVEVYKDTINVTSAAFQTDAADSLRIDNQGSETYLYNLYFRSTSNVRADEFTLIDPLENANLNQVRLVELFTPVVWGDTDGLFNMWYKTNLTDGSLSYSDISALLSNPDNPNNPNRTSVWPSTGWRLWQSNIPTTSSRCLKVVDLNLLEGEYITALRFEYGSVEIGFTCMNSSLQAMQQSKPNKPLAVDWTPQEKDDFYALGALQASGLKPATYLVICPEGMLPPTEIVSSVSAHIARNQVLTDEDYDEVLTRVIEPFMLPTVATKPLEFQTQASYPVIYPTGPSFPKTGESPLVVLSAFAGAVFMLAGLWLVLMSRRQLNLLDE